MAVTYSSVRLIIMIGKNCLYIEIRHGFTNGIFRGVMQYHK